MTRHSALTLGMGVALMTSAARLSITTTATDAAASVAQIGLSSAVSPGTPRDAHHSGYIVASS